MKNNLKNKIAFTNARLIDPNTGLDVIGGLLTENKIIKGFGKNLFNDNTPDDALKIDCKDNILYLTEGYPINVTLESPRR